jgi:hypothetical protein
MSKKISPKGLAREIELLFAAAVLMASDSFLQFIIWARQL